MNTAERAGRYLAKLPVVQSGQGGHAATFAAACRLVEFGLGFEVALQLMRQFNLTKCVPPWSEQDLVHKLKDAFRKTSPRHRFAQRSGVEPDTKPQPLPVEHCNAMPEGKRILELPEWTLGTSAEHSQLAAVRGLSLESVQIAVRRGLVRFGIFRGNKVWFLSDEAKRVVSARRMDGRHWLAGVKAWNLRGSQASWPVGIHESRPFTDLLLVEGGPDLLAAFHLIQKQGRETTTAPVVMLSAMHSLPPESLGLFQGKRVRIYAHAEETGLRAANRWMGQLRTSGVSVEIFSFSGLFQENGKAVKDLNDFVRFTNQPGALSQADSILP